MMPAHITTRVSSAAHLEGKMCTLLLIIMHNHYYTAIISFVRNSQSNRSR